MASQGEYFRTSDFPFPLAPQLDAMSTALVVGGDSSLVFHLVCLSERRPYQAQSWQLMALSRHHSV
jgi:hypothetical protein